MPGNKAIKKFSEYLVYFFKSTNCKANEPQLFDYNHIAHSFIATIEFWTKTSLPVGRVSSWSNSIRTTMCSVEPNSNFWIPKTERKIHLSYKKFQSQELLHFLLILTDCGYLVRAVAHPQRFWEQLEVRCSHICKSWRKP